MRVFIRYKRVTQVILIVRVYAHFSPLSRIKLVTQPSLG